MKFKNKMKKFFSLTRESAGGFTLVELIVVIAILGILAGVAIPAYSGYIKKANAAADLQLLDAVNTAFAAACMDNNVNHYNLTAAQAIMPLTADKKVDMDNVKPDAVVDSFKLFFDGNEDSAFKNIESLVFDPLQCLFVDGNGVYSYSFGGSTVTLNATDAAILAGNNAFSNRGAEALLNDVGVLENLLGNGVGEDILNEVKYSDPFLWALGSYAGMTKNANESDDEYLDRVAAYVLDENNASSVESAQIMFAASQAANATDEQITNLFTGTVTSNIEQKNADGTTNYNATMANAALAYGMYTAYLQRNPDIDPNTSAGSFTNVVNDAEFLSYLKTSQGQTDLEAYQAAMNVVSDNTSNSQVTSSILQNGIVGNEELTALMQQIMGN